MMDRITPGAFYGSAIAALCGLLTGLVLQQPWQKHPGGPQILFNSAAAAELARPAGQDVGQGPLSEDQQITEGDQQLAALDATYNDPGYIPPAPLPVTRLDPGRFDVQPAAVEPADREDADELADLADADRSADREDPGRIADARAAPASSDLD